MSEVSKKYWLKTKTGSGLVIIFNDVIHRAPRCFSSWKGKPLQTVITILKNKRELIDLQELVPEEISTYIEGNIDNGDSL